MQNMLIGIETNSSAPMAIIAHLPTVYRNLSQVEKLTSRFEQSEDAPYQWRNFLNSQICNRETKLRRGPQVRKHDLHHGGTSEDTLSHLPYSGMPASKLTCTFGQAKRLSMLQSQSDTFLRRVAQKQPTWEQPWSKLCLGEDAEPPRNLVLMWVPHSGEVPHETEALQICPEDLSATPQDLVRNKLWTRKIEPYVSWLVDLSLAKVPLRKTSFVKLLFVMTCFVNLSIVCKNVV